MFTHQQLIQPGGQIRSVQTLKLEPSVPRTSDTARQAGDFYFAQLAQAFHGAITVRTDASGGVQVGTLGGPLLTFHPPTAAVDELGARVTYRIAEGLLVQPGRRNLGALTVQLGRDQLSLTVDGYYGRLVGPKLNPVRTRLYLMTQSTVHIWVARRYLTALARALPTWQQHQGGTHT